MSDEISVLTEPKTKEPFFLLRYLQGAVFAFAAFILLISLTPLEKLDVPGVRAALVYGSIGCSIIAAIIHFPYVFWRLPKTALRQCAYAILIASFVFVVTVFGQVSAAYEMTPAGAKQKAEREREYHELEVAAAKAEAAKAKANAAVAEAQRLADVEKAEADTLAKVKGCLSWGGNFAPLEEDVKGRLHNPHAFEHVKTSVIGPTPDGDNLEMTFRAENGFGALRIGSVRAKINPDTCEIAEVGTLNSD